MKKINPEEQLGKAQGFFGEFKAFLTRGNVLDMAVGIIIGSAFTAIVTSLVNDVIDDKNLLVCQGSGQIRDGDFAFRFSLVLDACLIGTGADKIHPDIHPEAAERTCQICGEKHSAFEKSHQMERRLHIHSVVVYLLGDGGDNSLNFLWFKQYGFKSWIKELGSHLSEQSNHGTGVTG